MISNTSNGTLSISVIGYAVLADDKGTTSITFMLSNYARKLQRVVFEAGSLVLGTLQLVEGAIIITVWHNMTIASMNYGRSRPQLYFYPLWQNQFSHHLAMIQQAEHCS